MLAREPGRSRPRHRSCPGAQGPAIVILVPLALTTAAVAQGEPPPLEFQVKAAFLYNFAKFVNWPPEVFRDPDSAFVICLVDEEPFAQALEQAVLGKTVEGRAFQVRRLSSPDEAGSCQMLHLGATGSSRLTSLPRSIREAPILTIGDDAGFTRQGGIINFIIREHRVGFEINPDAAGRAGLRISSKLLQLASIVRDEARSEDAR